MQHCSFRLATCNLEPCKHVRPGSGAATSLLPCAYVFQAMVKQCRAPCRRLQSSSSSSSTSSSSPSSSSSNESSESGSSCSSCYEPTRFNSEAAVHTLHQQGLLRNKVLLHAPQFDPTDGAIVYATISKAGFAHEAARQQLQDHVSNTHHFCCKQPKCSLCKEVSCTKRAKLMLDFVRSISTQHRGNRPKCNAVVDRILSRRTETGASVCSACVCI